jgi:hypothetical protein
MTDEERGWAAGLFEGEGSVGLWGRKRPRIRASLEMNDEDSVRRFHRFIGFGSVSRSTRASRPDKATWSWTATGRANVTTLEFLISGLLGKRRQGQFDKALRRRD